MNYTDIHTFLTIASSPSLSKAAESLFVSQPALSHRLSALEEELGTELIIRKKGSRTLELTEARLRANGSSYGLRQEKSNLNSLRHSFGL